MKKIDKQTDGLTKVFEETETSISFTSPSREASSSGRKTSAASTSFGGGQEEMEET